MQCEHDKTVVYPGTFDPMTNGHLDIIERAAKLFPRVIIAIAENVAKRPCFSLQERLEVAQVAVQHFNNVSVTSFKGLLVTFMKTSNARVMIRGLRAVSDFEYEFQLANMNRQMWPALETLFLTPGQQNSYVSSTLVREIAVLGGDVSPFVPPSAARLLQKLAETP